MADSLITGDMLTENPKPGIQIRICGIPKKQDGEFYCPYCSFTSYDIEDFATSMCWDCVYSEEEQEDAGLRNADLRKGDIVRVSKEVEVLSTTAKGFYDKSTNFYGNSEEPLNEPSKGYKVELVRRTPEHFPPQAGDVWLGPNGTEWYIFSVGGLTNPDALRAMTSPHDGGSATNVDITMFKTMAIELLHRQGNRSG